MAIQLNSSLGRALVQQNKLTENDAKAFELAASASGGNFFSELVRSRRIDSREIAMFSSQTFGFPLLDLDSIAMETLPDALIDIKLMQKHKVAALYKRGNRLFVATSNPENMQGLDEIKFKTGLAIELVIVEDDKLGAFIQKAAESSQEAFNKLVDEEIDLNLEFIDEVAKTLQSETSNAEIEDAPIVKFIQKTLLDAINAGASDVHFEPYEKFYRIRYRIDGMLYEIAQPPLFVKEKLASRLKVISRLDISEKRMPQDGRMKLSLSETHAIDFRISTLPTLFGEKIVMRILDPSSAKLGIDALGYEPEQKEMLMAAIKRPYGMVLVTGPTGSGKTVSLYTCLNILNQPDINIATAEDPAEINLPGVNQVNINEKVGLTFAVALRAFLRQDPDVLMVGEIRDLETADIAVKAAQTGHLVLSTLHTNDAPSTLIRLQNMGMAPFNIASSVILITAQRLARRLCKCKEEKDIPAETLLNAGFTSEELDGSWRPYGPTGCDICQGRGYKGRVGIYQVMPISEEMSSIILNQGSSSEIADQAKREGLRDLRQSGLLKVKRGLTSLEEIEAITNR
ncbi:MAG: type IV-A pilus assembly ATPase PilB [Burkholderiales bacterium]|nr:type IV-A pilus assembly ATPase PilB [Burkholderiales bacterium]